MTATTAGPVSGQRGLSLIHRQLYSYPNTGARVFYLAVTVLATITLYYELYVGGSITTYLLANLGMSFTFYVLAVAFGNLVGAFGSLAAGLGDRYGRANIVVFGLLFSGVFVAFVIPTATTRWQFVIYTFVVGLVEGMCLVATPALIRDFSPQLGRGTAMGFWTSGPVLGSLVVAIVGSATLPALVGTAAYRHWWTHEYLICGIVGIVIFLVTFVFLRELSPQLRDQLMVSMRDRALIEARAKGLDVEAALRHHWRQLMKADILISAFAVAVMLLIYYALVGFLLIYVDTVFGMTAKQADGLGNWAWAFNAGAVILVGLCSDWVRVRKPFMVVGAIGAAVMVVLFLLQTDRHPSYYTLAAMLAIMLFFLGIAYTPWMASFTETVEHRNPAATATGLAIWGWLLRLVVFGSTALIPVVIHSVTPVIDYGPTVKADLAAYPSLTWAGTHASVIAEYQHYATDFAFASAHPAAVADATKYATQLTNAAKLAPELAVLKANAALFAQAAKYTPTTVPASLAAKLLAAAGGGAKGAAILAKIDANSSAITAILAVPPSVFTTVAPYSAQLAALAKVPASVTTAVTAGTAELTALSKVPPSVSAYVTAHGTAVAAAAKAEPGQWRTWFWVCFGGLIFFLLSIPLLRGRWRTRDAKRDEEAHEAMVKEEMAKMGLESTA
jgi:MFS family permease